MMTLAQWNEQGERLFGSDRTSWVFRCPSCHLELSVALVRRRFAEHLPRLRERKYAVEAECIGRHIAGVGCDWAAYGLFRGPVVVVDGGREIACFEFGDAVAPDGADS